MRRVLFAAAIMIVALCALVFSSQAENVSLRGDYVEVRTASVFAGACHYNGEVVTTGRDAMMAWNVTSGSWQGVDLTQYYPTGSAPIIRGEAVNTATTYGYDSVTMMQETKTTVCQVEKAA